MTATAQADLLGLVRQVSADGGLGRVTDAERTDAALTEQIISAAVDPERLAEATTEARLATPPPTVTTVQEILPSRWGSQYAKAEADFAALPCKAHHQAGDDEAGAAKCTAEGAYHCCSWRNDAEHCSLLPLVTPAARAARNLDVAGVPALEAEVVLAAMARIAPDGGLLSPAPLRPTNALRVTRPFLSRRPQTVPLDGADTLITFFGSETILVLGGGCGSGKSVAAAWAVREHGGLWVDARKFARLNDLDERCEAATLLVLDDAGEEHDSEKRFATSRIAAVLCARQARKALTIVTSNFDDVDAFLARYGERVRSRMKQSGRFIIPGGPDLRGSK